MDLSTLPSHNSWRPARPPAKGDVGQLALWELKEIYLSAEELNLEFDRIIAQATSYGRINR